LYAHLSAQNLRPLTPSAAGTAIDKGRRLDSPVSSNPVAGRSSGRCPPCQPPTRTGIYKTFPGVRGKNFGRAVAITARYQIFIAWNLDEVIGVKYCRQVEGALWFDGEKISEGDLQ